MSDDDRSLRTRPTPRPRPGVESVRTATSEALVSRPVIERNASCRQHPETRVAAALLQDQFTPTKISALGAVGQGRELSFIEHLEEGRAAKQVRQRRGCAVIGLFFALGVKRVGKVGRGGRGGGDTIANGGEQVETTAEDGLQDGDTDLWMLGEKRIERRMCEPEHSTRADTHNGGRVPPRRPESGPTDRGPGRSACANVKVLVPFLESDLKSDLAHDEEVEGTRRCKLPRQHLTDVGRDRRRQGEQSRTDSGSSVWLGTRGDSRYAVNSFRSALMT